MQSSSVRDAVSSVNTRVAQPNKISLDHALHLTVLSYDMEKPIYANNFILNAIQAMRELLEGKSYFPNLHYT